MNKRQLKKQIRGLCGGLACDCVTAGGLIPSMDAGQLDSLIVKAAKAQTRALRQVSVSFDRMPADFDSRRDYNKARRTYMKKALGAMSSDLNGELEAVVKTLNSMLTPELKAANKEAAKA